MVQYQQKFTIFLCRIFDEVAEKLAQYNMAQYTDRKYGKRLFLNAITAVI